MPADTFHRPSRRPSVLRFGAVLIAAALLPTASHALYKVIGPDGKVTYTDRPPATTRGDRVTPLGAGGAAPVVVALPLELRQASARFPVTLYVTANCEPCDSGRLLLRQRGIPYAERQVVTTEDSDALQRLSGARTAPTLTIGAQALKGLSAEVWNSYLDSAGYPRESRLPTNYQFEAAAPLTQRRDAVQPVNPTVARPELPGTASRDDDPAPAPPTTVRF